jgi:hypothetical protein
MDDIRIVLGSLRYKTATNTDLSIPTPLVQNSKNIQEFDRSIDVNLAQVFDDERQKSTIFRPTCKFQLLYENSYTGSTNYTPLENNLYYINENQLTLEQCDANPNDVTWEGFVQYHEFDFIRSDYDVIGYTQPPNNHINFISKSASTYNWNFFLSYPFKNIDKKLSYYYPKQNTNISWNAVDGIPFIILITDGSSSSPIPLSEGGNSIIQFKCPVKHGLSESEFVKIKLTNGYTNTFQVFSFGNGLPGTEEYIFNLFNIGYTGTTFSDNVKGTFKRVINNENPNDTTSKYYVLQHKILSNVDDYVLVNAGFEKNIFGSKKKFESTVYTPNKVKRVSYKEGSQSYTLSFNKDFDISSIRDNQKRPISELYITTIWKGYFGLTFGLKPLGGNYIGLKEGYDFNLPLDNFNKPNKWWEVGNSDSNFVDVNNQPYPLGVLTPATPGNIKNFVYMESLKEGDVLDGGFYEWNDYEQIERLISDINHKFTFNSSVFNIGCCSLLCKMTCDNQFGYYYKPHSKMKIRAFSDYIETGNVNNIADVPDYAYYSTTYGSFIWRDIYTYGFKDSNKNGVDYPFLNGKHYPYENFVFRIIPEGTNYIESSLNNYATLYGAAQPTKDDCE